MRRLLNEMDGDLLFKVESYALQGAIFEVYREMGCGFVEPVYQECLENELARRHIPFESQIELDLRYKEELLEQKFKPDFICYQKIIIEIKAVRELAPEHAAQLINYLKVTDLQLGLLVNFSSYPKATIKRFARSTGKTVKITKDQD